MSIKSDKQVRHIVAWLGSALLVSLLVACGGGGSGGGSTENTTPRDGSFVIGGADSVTSGGVSAVGVTSVAHSGVLPTVVITHQLPGGIPPE